MKKLNNKEFILKATKIHNNVYDYSATFYINSRINVDIICKLHGKFSIKANSHLNGNGCPICGREKCRKNKILNYSKNLIKTFIKVHGDRYDYSKVIYTNNISKICIICSKHGEFFQDSHTHIKGSGCPSCGKINSKMETKWLDYYKVPKENRNIKVGKYKIDGIDYVNKIIYEFDGDFWHGNPKIYNQLDINPVTKTTFKELYENTLKKKKYYQKKGYKVVSIWENDYINQISHFQ
jgi:hypothetical protein